jgi:hypothetical protein
VAVRSVEHWSKVDADLGSRLATRLGLASSNGAAAPAAATTR